MKNYVLHFIRHGATELQRQGIYMGRRTGSELSAEGIGELLRLQREYDYPPVEVVFSSPLPHCLQTADFLYPQSRLMVVDELAEMDFGAYEGKTLEELKDDPAFCCWLANSHTEKPPEGESGEEFLIRIQAAVAAMIDYMVQNEVFEAAVVTHGGVIATLMSTLGLPHQPLQFWKTGGGRGFTCFINPQIWQNDHLMEVAGILPHGAPTACPAETDEKGR